MHDVRMTAMWTETLQCVVVEGWGADGTIYRRRSNSDPPSSLYAQQWAGEISLLYIHICEGTQCTHYCCYVIRVEHAFWNCKPTLMNKYNKNNNLLSDYSRADNQNSCAWVESVIIFNATGQLNKNFISLYLYYFSGNNLWI